jgi:hypothetical protein
LNDTSFKTTSGQNVTKYLFSLLEDRYDNTGSTNFETILALIENLYEYYDIKYIKGTNPDSHPIWPLIYELDKGIEDKIFSSYEISVASNFSFVDEEFVYIITKDQKKVNNTPCAKSMWRAVLVKKIYDSIVTIITHKIWDYNLKAKVADNKYSNYLNKLIIKLEDNQISGRFYTTNYDRLLPIILKNKHLIFDGYTDENIITETFKFNHKKTLIDFDSLCYYNLHGSIYWDEGSTTDLLNKESILVPTPPFPTNIGNRNQVDQAKEVLFTNILVGNNKSQKINIPPLNYFDSAFNRDCINSEIIVVIGSSLSDYNIRRSIYTALSDKSKKLVIIDKVANGNIDNIKTVIGDLSPSYERAILTESASKDWFINEEENCYLYINGFDGFLENEAWKDLDCF